MRVTLSAAVALLLSACEKECNLQSLVIINQSRLPATLTFADSSQVDIDASQRKEIAVKAGALEYSVTFRGNPGYIHLNRITEIEPCRGNTLYLST